MVTEVQVFAIQVNFHMTKVGVVLYEHILA